MNEINSNPKRLRFTPEITLGNVLQLLSIVAAVIGMLFLAHRHGQLRGLVEASKDKI